MTKGELQILDCRLQVKADRLKVLVLLSTSTLRFWSRCPAIVPQFQSAICLLPFMIQKAGLHGRGQLVRAADAGLV